MSGDEESAGFPTAPPSFGHPEPETSAKATVPGGFRPPGPPAAPWWAPAVPEEPQVAADPLPGVLVAGPGVPVVDTRRAVPREPLVRQTSLAETTDPDGFPAITDDTVVDFPRPQTPPANPTLAPSPNPTLVDAVLLTWQPLEAVRPPALPEEDATAPEAPALEAPALEAPAPEAPTATTPTQETWQPLETEHPPAATAAEPGQGPEQESGTELLQELTATAAPSPGQPFGPELPRESVAGETWQPRAPAASADQQTETAAWPMPGPASDQKIPQKPGAGETWQPAAAVKAEPVVSPAPVPVTPVFDAPVLVPAAILPPPVVTLMKPTPEQAIAAKTVLARLTPVVQEQEQPAPMPPTAARVVSAPVREPRKPRSKQPAWLAVFVLVPAMVAGFVGYLIVSGPEHAKRTPVAGAQPTTPAAQSTTPAATTSPSVSASASPTVTGSLPAGPSVDSDQTDPKPLTIREIFPAKRIPLSNALFLQDYKSLNKRCDYAASGAMATALLNAKCQAVVRSTFVTRNKKIGVTAGVVAMPTKVAAVRTSKAGDAAHLAWFRAMPGKRTQALLDGGGHAASTTYGRYIIYAYVQYLDGTTAQPEDPALIQVAKDFIGYLNEPLKAR